MFTEHGQREKYANTTKNPIEWQGDAEREKEPGVHIWKPAP